MIYYCKPIIRQWTVGKWELYRLVKDRHQIDFPRLLSPLKYVWHTTACFERIEKYHSTNDTSLHTFNVISVVVSWVGKPDEENQTRIEGAEHLEFITRLYLGSIWNRDCRFPFWQKWRVIL